MNCWYPPDRCLSNHNVSKVLQLVYKFRLELLPKLLYRDHFLLLTVLLSLLKSCQILPSLICSRLHPLESCLSLIETRQLPPLCLVGMLSFFDRQKSLSSLQYHSGLHRLEELPYLGSVDQGK